MALCWRAGLCLAELAPDGGPLYSKIHFDITAISVKMPAQRIESFYNMLQIHFHFQQQAEEHLACKIISIIVRLRYPTKCTSITVT